MAPMVVVSAATKDGVTTVALANVMKDGSKGPGFTVEVSDKGVCMVANASGKVDPPHWWLKLPAKPGSKWEVPVPGGAGKQAVMVRKVVGDEKVVTPAGTFEAVRVDVEYPEGTPWVTEWWAPGRGKVKQANPGEAHGLVLKSVTQAAK